MPSPEFCRPECGAEDFPDTPKRVSRVSQWKRVKRFWCVGSTIDNNRATMAQKGIEDYMEVEGHIDPDVQRNVSSLITAVSLSHLDSV